MTGYRIIEGGTTNSFSSYSNLLASAIMATALLGQAVEDVDQHVQRNLNHEWHIEHTSTQKSFHNTTVTQASTAYELVNALQHVYEDLATQQQDLDLEIKQALYSNLWSLYS